MTCSIPIQFTSKCFLSDFLIKCFLHSIHFVHFPFASGFYFVLRPFRVPCIRFFKIRTFCFDRLNCEKYVDSHGTNVTGHLTRRVSRSALAISSLWRFFFSLRSINSIYWRSLNGWLLNRLTHDELLTRIFRASIVFLPAAAAAAASVAAAVQLQTVRERTRDFLLLLAIIYYLPFQWRAEFVQIFCRLRRFLEYFFPSEFWMANQFCLQISWFECFWSIEWSRATRKKKQSNGNLFLPRASLFSSLPLGPFHAKWAKPMPNSLLGRGNNI